MFMLPRLTRRLTAPMVLAVAVLVAGSQLASAAVAQRTFVASNGNDANACTLVAPCRSFAAALTKTNAGGEVIVLDSAGYGPVTIAQSVSIIAPPGIYAGISVVSGNGVTIATPGIVVTLRGLSINGQGGNSGIYFLPGTYPWSTLHVENCVVSTMSGAAIVAAFGRVYISDTAVRDNAGGGIVVLAGAYATLTRVRSENNGSTPVQAGILISGGAHATISDSVVAASNLFGIGIDVENGAEVSIQRTTISGDEGTYSIRASSATDGQSTVLSIDSSTIEGSYGGPAAGATAGLVRFSVSRTKIRPATSRGDGFGVSAYSTGTGRVIGMVTDCTVIGSEGVGISASGSGTMVSAKGNALEATSFGFLGLSADDGGTIVASSNIVTSPVGLRAASGTIQSRGDNTVTGTVSGNVVAIGGH